MKNSKKLRKELAILFKQLKKGDADIQLAKTMVATSNSILKSAQLELEHSKMTGSTDEIEFLKS